MVGFDFCINGQAKLFAHLLPNGGRCWMKDRIVNPVLTDHLMRHGHANDVGGIVVLILFALLIWRLLACAWRATDPFAMLIGCGMATMIFFQVVVNVGMVNGLLPVTGIPLPFISYGGASLVCLAAGLGTLQSTNLRREKPEW